MVEAEQAVQALKEADKAGEEGTPPRQVAARKRAVNERVARVKQALKEIQTVKATRQRSHKPKAKQREVRSSTTDPEARVMKMADGGYRPAYNGQLAVDVGSEIVVGVAASNQVDQGQMMPMLDQIQRRCGRDPQEHLVDGGFVTQADMEEAFQRKIDIYAPLPENDPGKSNGPQPYHLQTPVVAAWRNRMNAPEGKRRYKQRSASIEWVNALARNRGLLQFWVRGKQKVQAVLLWFALAHNLWVLYRLRHQAAGGLA